jgi:hypothetical protein
MQQMNLFTSGLFPFSKSLLEKTRKILEPIAHKKLSDEDCNEILNTLVGLELLLREIAKEG